LIRDKKRIEHFTPNDVLGRLLTFEIKDVALKANKSSKQGTSNKAKGSKQASTSKPKEVKQVEE
jgi:hypothetical protein